jgi:tetratricopeptide (TPR) repeat protein
MEPWQHQVRNKLADGEICFDGKDYDGALAIYREAFHLIPEPRVDHGESTQVIAAIGDCFCQLGDFEKSLDAFEDVLLCPGGAANPFIRLRRGQVCHHIGDAKRAQTELVCAYMNGGLEVFEGEDPMYLELIRDSISALDEQGFTPGS